jgi:pimeloyl-ACP methyl ester carboxylesterase
MPAHSLYTVRGAKEKLLKSAKGALSAPPLKGGTQRIWAARDAPFCASYSEAQRGAPFPRRRTEQELRRFKRRGTPRFAQVTQKRKGARLSAPPYRTGTPQIQAARTPRFARVPQKTLYNSRMSVFRSLPLALVLTTVGAAQQTISFSSDDGGRVCADLYGQGGRAVLLAHGGRFNKESWRDQAQALVSKGFHVLAIDFRGIGCSTGPGQADFDHAPFENDVLAAVHYLKAHGAKTVSVIGGSFGGGAAGDASIKSPPGDIDRIVFLGAAPNLPAEKLKSRSLFIVARDDSNGSGPRLPGIRAQYDKAPQPKELIVLDGSAHAQFLFQTEQSSRVMREILRFLTMP